MRLAGPIVFRYHLSTDRIRATIVMGAAFILTLVLRNACAETDRGGEVLEHSLSGYLSYAFGHNPMLAMARNEQASLQMKSRGAVALPGPSVMYEADMTGGAWRSSMIGVSQIFPWPGEIRWKFRTAVLESEAAGYRVVEKKVMVAFDVRETYGMLYETGKTLGYLKESSDLLKRILEVAQASYASGKGPQSSIVKLRIEMAALEDRIREQEEDHKAKDDQRKRDIG